MAQDELDPRAGDAGAGACTDLAEGRVNSSDNIAATETSKGEQDTQDFITILTTKGPILTKRILRGQDGRPMIQDYDNAKRFDITSVEFKGLDELARALDKLAPNSCVVLGRLIPGTNPKNARRRIYPDPQTGDPATLEAWAHAWAPIDLDALDCPDGLDPVNEPERAVKHIVDTVLPEPMRDTDVYWQLTSGAGFKPGIRLRLVFMCDRAMTNVELKRWLGGCDGVDAAIYTANQLIYFAKPIFDGVDDPVPRRSGISRGTRRLVSPPDTIPERPHAWAGTATRSGGIGYEAFCARIGDHDEGEGFFEPIKSAVASWIAGGGLSSRLRADIEERIRSAPRDPSVHPDAYIEQRIQDLDGLIRWVERQQEDQEDGELAGDGGQRGRPSHAHILAEVAERAELFHTADATGFADIVIDGHRETWATRSKGFRLWLTQQFFNETASAPSQNAVRSALDVIEARARFDGPERVLNLRVGELETRIYIDLCDSGWRAIEVDAAGWRIVDEPPVRFRRTPGMRPLPVPLSGGSAGNLRQFLNLSSDDEFVMLISWLLAALRGRGPFPLLVVGGEQGSAKTFLGRLVRSLVDPSALQDRSLPREDRDLFIAANNAFVLAFDNLSGMPPWISDTLCRLATGGGFATRELYTDSDEMLFEAKRPVILNGIEDVATRGDLADRSIVLTLAAIPEDKRRAEAEILAEFDRAHPSILGALLDVVSHGLRMLPETRLERLPRMADFALWATACETALWARGTFERAYAENRAGMVEKVLGDDPFGVAVRDLVNSLRSGFWKGTATELLRLLNMRTEPKSRDKYWPGAPNKVAGRLRRVQPFLRQLGIVVENKKDAANVTVLTIRRTDAAGAVDELPI